MRKIVFIGRSGSGKTSITQAIKGQPVKYHKTQYVHYGDLIIDTPGEYAETRELGAALALYAYESDVVGLLVSATEPYSLFGPNLTCMANREVIGIITKIDHPDANIPMVRQWLEDAGCEKIFPVSSITREGIDELIEYLA